MMKIIQINNDDYNRLMEMLYLACSSLENKNTVRSTWKEEPNEYYRITTLMKMEGEQND